MLTTPIAIMNEKHNFYLNKDEPNKSCLLALRDIILKQDENITETTKYGMPCFCYKQKMFCYLWEDKKTKEPYILFVEGQHLHHPELESGNRARMKIFRVNPLLDIPLKTINFLINEALELYRNGTIHIK
ncbi:DUF1801 domain-containing protein [Maribacter sp. HTCC2170]|uniref:DUF1801 domain-containing protein n=1 Tax=Maribacter sp. (strain HTCC2170 / KCCM 42371) TaxID=313603 RepID=UPI00006B49C0|nr:DUF1801 domain-containing protein [Maribacter sp. HTCC2170]EAR00978.1 hypothetical protein FB2170_09411 [Maribacter sp. HTCC2170]